jgi:hypothetical protein
MKKSLNINAVMNSSVQFNLLNLKLNRIIDNLNSSDSTSTVLASLQYASLLFLLLTIITILYMLWWRKESKVIKFTGLHRWRDYNKIQKMILDHSDDVNHENLDIPLV